MLRLRQGESNGRLNRAERRDDILAANVDYSSIPVLEDFSEGGSRKCEVQINGRRRRQ